MTDEFPIDNGVQQNFQGGFLAWNGGEVYGGYWETLSILTGNPSTDDMAQARARRVVTTSTPTAAQTRPPAEPHQGFEFYTKQCTLFGEQHVLHGQLNFPAEQMVANLKCGVRGAEGTGRGWGWRHIKRRHSIGDSSADYDNSASKWENAYQPYIGGWDLRMSFSTLIALHEASSSDVTNNGEKLEVRRRIPLMFGGDYPVRVVVGTRDNSVITSFPEL